MTRIVTVSGSPFPGSRTQLLAEWVGARLAAEGFDVHALNVRDLSAEELLWCRIDAPTVKSALEQIDRAHGIILVTPVHKAAYSAPLKAFLDVMPQFGLTDKVVLPLAVGGSLAHALAIDYGLRPVLASMMPSHVVTGVFVMDKLLERVQPHGLKVSNDILPRLDAAISEFSLSLHRHHRPHPELPARNGKHENVAVGAV
jgi:FMN reductase